MFRRLKRRIKKKTDYNQRLTLLKSGKHRLVVRKSLRNLLAQIVEYNPDGDKILVSAMTKELSKYGWLGGCNLSAAYLTGLLVGYKALKKNIKGAVLDIGLQISTKGNKIYALALGCIDAGMEIPISKDVVPSKERIEGRHIENYAKLLKDKNPDEYQKRFSSYIKKGLNPEAFSEHFKSVKKTIENTLSK